MKRLLLLLVAGLVFFGLTGCNRPAESVPNDPDIITDSPPRPETPAVPKPSPAETEKTEVPSETEIVAELPEEEKPPKEESPVNSTDKSASYNGIEVSVNSFKEYPGDSIKEDYPDVTSVQNGYKWVLVDLELKNGTNEAIGDDSDYGWRFYIVDYDENENGYASVYMRDLGGDAIDLSSMLEPGQSRSGKFLFTLKDGCNTYKLRYQPYKRSVDGTFIEVPLNDAPNTGLPDPSEIAPSGKALDLLETSATYNGIEITVNSVKEYPGDSIKADYPDVTSVQNGYKWVLVDLELKNGTKEAIGDDTDYGWMIDMIDSDGNKNFYTSVYMRDLGSDAIDLSTMLEPGQSRSGKFLYTLKAESITYSLCYQPYSRFVDSTVMEIKLR